MDGVFPRHLAAACVLVWVVSACSRDNNNRAVVYHPTPDNIPAVSNPRFELRTAGPIAEEWLWEGQEMVAIGVREGESHDMISEVLPSGIDTDRNGVLYYTDFIAQEVRAFTYDGAWLGSMGGSGSGPGELGSPRALTVFAPDDRVFVTDSRATHVFQRTGTGFALVDTHYPDLYGHLGSSSCTMGQHYYMAGYDEESGGVIHQFMLDGTWVRSFGQPYKASSFIASMMTRDCFLACNEERGVLAHITNHVPVMTGLTTSGDTLWQVAFPDYQPDIVRERFDPETGRTYHRVMREKGHSRFMSVFVDGTEFYVTYAFPRTTLLPPKMTLDPAHAFRVDATTGLGEYLGPAGPPEEVVIAKDGDYRFTLTRKAGFPQIRIYKPRPS